MNTLTLYYSVSNGGDGSAYPKFSLSKELADIHQDIQDELGEGWGEPCVGAISLESESPITIREDDFKWFITEESLLKELKDYLDEDDYLYALKAQDFVDRINALKL